MRTCFFLFLFFTSISMPAQKNILEDLLKLNGDNENLAAVLSDAEQYDVHLVYTQINRDENNHPHFTTYTYGYDPQRYFYPASSVKMPIAFLALEKLNQLGIVGLDKNSVMKHGAGSEPQAPAETDSTSATNLPSVAHYVKKLFMVSDNDAYNRLYEFVGQKQINEALWGKGFEELKLTHRVGIGGFDAEANRHTNPVSFYEGEKLIYHQDEVYGAAEKEFNLTETHRGVGYQEGDEIIDGPFDFSKKNYISLKALQDIQKAVLFPEAVPEDMRFDLTESDYQFLYQVMSELPKESQYPNYEGKGDNYVKFFIFGDQEEKESHIPDHIRIFNKVGWAYGFLTDVSYIVDFENNVEFLIAGNIHVSGNGIYNDGVYEYNEIGLPFLAEVGRLIYEYEKARERKFKPDLSRFKVEKYD